MNDLKGVLVNREVKNDLSGVLINNEQAVSLVFHFIRLGTST
jgi:hypothetical protein